MKEKRKGPFEFSRVSLGSPSLAYLRMSLFVACACLVLSVFLVPSFLFSPPAYNEGDVVEETIKARRTYKDIVDEERTQEKRAEAEANARAVYDYNESLRSESASRIAEAFKILKEKKLPTTKDILEAKAFFENKTGVKIRDQFFYLLRLLKFQDELLARLMDIIKKFDQEMI